MGDHLVKDGLAAAGCGEGAGESLRALVPGLWILRMTCGGRFRWERRDIGARQVHQEGGCGVIG